MMIVRKGNVVFVPDHVWKDKPLQATVDDTVILTLAVLALAFYMWRGR